MIYKSYLIEQNIELIDKNLFLFFGENLGLQNELKNKIKKRNKHGEFIIFNQDEILKNQNLIFNEINNISLFEKEKIYFIEQTNDKILEIIKEIKTKIDNQKIYLFSQILDKKSKIRNYFEKSENCGAVVCYLDSDISIKRIISNKLKGFDGLTPHNINLIAKNSNLDRVKLNNELDKIIIYFNNKKIETGKLEVLLNIKINDDFNSLKDEAMKGNRIKTNELLSDTIIEPEKNVFYLTLINQRLYKLFEILTFSKNDNLENSINKLKPPVFWKDKPNFIAQARKWNHKRIKLILDKTYKIEIEIKSNSSINKNILIKKLLVDMCGMANAS